VIAGYTRPHGSTLITHPLSVAAIAFVSVIGAALVVMMQDMAIITAAILGLIGLIFWRPRYGIYATILLAVAFDPQDQDPLTTYGLIVHNDFSSWSPLGFFIVTPLELLVIVTVVAVLMRDIVERKSWPSAQLWWPHLIFLGLVLASIAYGTARGGNFHHSLWETRSIFVAGMVALLVPRVMPERRHVQRVMALLVLAVVWLSVETIWRRFALVDTGEIDLPVEFAFPHETPIFMNLVILLLVARLVWPATGRQRLAALLIPLVVYAEMLTQRRAGWVTLDAGLALIMIFTFRMKRRVFYFVVLPLLVVYMGYLATFWNASGPIAEPARAIRSINDPEGRDVASNWTRVVERANVRLNIKANPVLGLGFGKEYVFYYNMPDLSFWPFWRYIPHNGVMFLWMDMGPLGFITFLTLAGAGIVRGVQVLKRSTNDHSAPLLVALVCFLPMFMIFCYVDVGINVTRTTLLFGFVLGVIGTWGRDMAVQPAPQPVRRPRLMTVRPAPVVAPLPGQATQAGGDA
jgi:hypothetical protein